MPENETIVSASPTQDTSVIATEAQETQQQFNMEEYVRSNMEQRFNPQPIENNEQQSQEQNNAAQADNIAQTPVLIPIDTFKEYGFESQDSIVEAIKEYKALKSAPPQPEPFKFENEKSEKLFRAWQAGKEDEVFNILAEEKKLEALANAEVDEKTADEILKLDMQVKYKDLNLTQAEIDYKFNKQYGIPKAPVQGDLEDDTDFELRKSAWQEQVNDITMSKIIDAKLAKPTLAAAKTNIKFPELNNTADEGYLEYQKNLKLGEEIEAEDREAYKAFSPESIEFKSNYIDEKNGVKVDFKFRPDDASFSEAKEMASDVNKLFQSFIGKDGKPNRQEFLEFVYYGKNRHRVVAEAVKQAKTETIISKLPDNTQGSFSRQPAQSQQVSQFDEQMRQAFALWPGQQASRVS